MTKVRPRHFTSRKFNTFSSRNLGNQGRIKLDVSWMEEHDAIGYASNIEGKLENQGYFVVGSFVKGGNYAIEYCREAAA